jgi:hypothetical protein
LDHFSAVNARVESEYLPAQAGFNAGTRVTTSVAVA